MSREDPHRHEFHFANRRFQASTCVRTAGELQLVAAGDMITIDRGCAKLRAGGEVWLVEPRRPLICLHPVVASWSSCHPFSVATLTRSDSAWLPVSAEERVHQLDFFTWDLQNIFGVIESCEGSDFVRASLVHFAFAVAAAEIHRVFIKNRKSGADLVCSVLSKIDESLMCQMSVSELTGLYGRLCQRFARKFKNLTGLPPYAFILIQRLRRACLMLETTDMEVVRVALDCGFASQSHMTTHFTRVVGLPPAAYRKRFQKLHYRAT